MYTPVISSIVEKHQQSYLNRSSIGVVTLCPRQPNSCKVYLQLCHNGIKENPFETIDEFFGELSPVNVKFVIDTTNPSCLYVQNNTGKDTDTAERYVFEALNISFYHCFDPNVSSVFWDLR